jgi:hypothetical protein
VVLPSTTATFPIPRDSGDLVAIPAIAAFRSPDSVEFLIGTSCS